MSSSDFIVLVSAWLPGEGDPLIKIFYWYNENFANTTKYFQKGKILELEKSREKNNDHEKFTLNSCIFLKFRMLKRWKTLNEEIFY